MTFGSTTPAEDETNRPSAWRLRAYLATLVLALVVPGLLFTGFLLDRYAKAERARMEQQVQERASNIAAAVDRRIGGLIEALRVLAMSSLDEGGVEAFHRRAVEARDIVGRNIVLREASGQQVANARVAWGAPLPRLRLPSDERARTERRTVVSEVFQSPLSGERMVAIVTPIFEGADARYLLSLSIDLVDTATLLTDVKMPEDQVAAIFDRTGVVVARSRDHARFAGQTALLPPEESRTGVRLSNNLDGEPAIVAWSRSSLTGWYVAASAPRSAIDTPVRAAWSALAAIGAVTLLISIIVAWVLSKRISGALKSLAAAGLELGARRRAPRVHTQLVEANAIGDALRVAGERLEDYEGRLEKAFCVARMFSFEWTAGQDDIIRSSSAADLLGMAREAAQRGTRADYRARVYPEDAGSFDRASEALTPAKPTYRIEYRYLRPDGDVCWFESSGHGEFDGAGALTRVTGFTIDVTARKQAQIRQDLLVRELHHRVKNNLATVLAVANLSGRNAVDIEDYKRRLRARIQSMARSHTLLTENAFQRAPLRDVLRNELEAYADAGEERARLEGPDVEVSAEAAIGLGMAFHELATNAGKYGALSSETGRLHVTWRFEDNVDEKVLRVLWTESGGPAVTAPTRVGFGTRLLENVIGGQLGGRVELRYLPEGLNVEIVAPLERYTTPDVLATAQA